MYHNPPTYIYRRKVRASERQKTPARTLFENKTREKSSLRHIIATDNLRCPARCKAASYVKPITPLVDTRTRIQSPEPCSIPICPLFKCARVYFHMENPRGARRRWRRHCGYDLSPGPLRLYRAARFFFPGNWIISIFVEVSREFFQPLLGRRRYCA